MPFDPVREGPAEVRADTVHIGVPGCEYCRRPNQHLDYLEVTSGGGGLLRCLSHSMLMLSFALA